MRPVPPVSPRPPPPGPSRPSRNPIMRLILWATEPSMIKGMAMGVILALVISVAFRVEAMWLIATSLLTLQERSNMPMIPHLHADMYVQSIDTLVE